MFKNAFLNKKLCQNEFSEEQVQIRRENSMKIIIARDAILVSLLK